MDELLKLLKENALETPANLAKMLALSEADVRARISAYEQSGMIRGYQAVINENEVDPNRVHAVIEVKITPEREGGFDRVADRLSRFPEVESVLLMSGGYDLLVFVNGANLKQVASFVSETLSTISGVLSTSTHFRLKTYKDRGVLMEGKKVDDRLTVAP